MSEKDDAGRTPGTENAKLVPFYVVGSILAGVSYAVGAIFRIGRGEKMPWPGGPKGGVNEYDKEISPKLV